VGRRQKSNDCSLKWGGAGYIESFFEGNGDGDEPHAGISFEAISVLDEAPDYGLSARLTELRPLPESIHYGVGAEEVPPEMSQLPAPAPPVYPHRHLGGRVDH
jgi:hypothetical protein